jgi:putative transposase
MADRPNRRPQRRPSLRWDQWDYSTPGVYFVTICTHQRLCLFDDPQFRATAENAWRAIPNRSHARHVQLDHWVVMPDHVHGLLAITYQRAAEQGGDAPEGSRNTGAGVSARRPGLQPGSLGAIIGQYKSRVARWINLFRRTPGTRVWQRGYYDRVVRNDDELERLRHYIIQNPVRWAEERDNLDTLIARMNLHD